MYNHVSKFSFTHLFLLFVMSFCKISFTIVFLMSRSLQLSESTECIIFMVWCFHEKEFRSWGFSIVISWRSYREKWSRVEEKAIYEGQIRLLSVLFSLQRKRTVVSLSGKLWYRYSEMSNKALSLRSFQIWCIIRAR